MARWFGRAARSDSAPSRPSLGHRRPGPLALAGPATLPARPNPARRPGWAERHDDTPGLAMLRRAVEILVAAAVLGLAAPLLAAAVLAALVGGSGPVVERAGRIGRHGRPFTLYRLRADGPGRLLKICRIEDVLQLVNVLKGEMALIGPRPEAPASAAEHARWIPRWGERQAVRPGVTGWAQVHQAVSPLDRGGSLAAARSMLGYDLYYVQHRSLGLDLRILLATLRVVLVQKRAD